MVNWARPYEMTFVSSENYLILSDLKEKDDGYSVIKVDVNEKSHHELFRSPEETYGNKYIFDRGLTGKFCLSFIFVFTSIIVVVVGSR